MKNEYRVVRESHTDITYYVYKGYIDGEYAGKISGLPYLDLFDIMTSELEPKFRGKKCVRAFREIVKGIEEDYNTIQIRVCNKDNGEIKLVLSAGFHIIGTIAHKGDLVVELIKVKGENL